MTAPPAEPLTIAPLKARAAAFFFAEEVPYGVAAARIALPIPLLYDALLRWPHVREIYSADGAPAALWHTYGWPNALPELPGWAAAGLFAVYLLALACALVGWKARLNCALAAAGCFYFCGLDGIGSLNKYTVIGTHLLALLALSRCGAVWSVDAAAARRRAAAEGRDHTPGRFPAWPRRLIQLHIGLVYFGAAFTKLHVPDFFTGDQMVYWMATHVNRLSPLAPLMIEYPTLLQIGAYATCCWELTFLFLAWNGWGRRIMLGLGVKFHLMTTLTLGLFLFPQVCWAAYWAYMTEADVAAFRKKWEKLKSRSPALASLKMPRPALPAGAVRWGYLAVAPAVALLGTGAEYHADPYGERSPDGPPALEPIDEGLVRAMTGPHRPPRAEDLLWNFEVGTFLVGENLAGRGDAFDCNTTLIAQAWLSPPHDDVVLECAIAHPGGPEGAGPPIERQRSVLTRAECRSNFVWELDSSLPAGEYRMTLAIDGEPVASRPFVLRAD